MTLINLKNKSIWFILINFVFLSSCETINEIAGLSKAEIDDSLISETPDLILPPDFDKEPSRTPQSSKVVREQLPLNNFQQTMNYRTVNPKVTNFFLLKLIYNLRQHRQIQSKSLNKIKNLLLESGSTVNMLMALKGVIFTTDLFMTKATIFLEGMCQIEMLLPFKIFRRLATKLFNLLTLKMKL